MQGGVGRVRDEGAGLEQGGNWWRGCGTEQEWAVIGGEDAGVDAGVGVGAGAGAGAGAGVDHVLKHLVEYRWEEARRHHNNSAKMMAVASAEKRPLKRQKLGPPDVYPQDAKQKEDELDDVSVKQGFTHRPQIQDEYSSAQNTSITPAKVANYFNAILKKKAECNQLPDTARKKQQINIKDNFWLVTPRSKAAIEAWFKDLAGSKPLTSLAKKVPIFSKREDMFLTLCEYSVPMLRATWFIKMTSAYQESKVAESKIKKRQQPDIAQEWTQTLTRLLREQLNKIAEIYLGNPSAATPPVGAPAGSSTPGGTMTSPASVTSTPSSTPAQPPQSSPHNPGSSSGSTPAAGTGQNTTAAQLAHVLRNWNYCLQLAHFMYQEGLLDRQELLEWVVDAFVRWRGSEHDVVLRVVLPLPLQYLDEITQSEYLSRKLAHYSAVKLTQLCHDSGYSSPRPQSPVNPSSNGLVCWLSLFILCVSGFHLIGQSCTFILTPSVTGRLSIFILVTIW
ncbi:Mediator of RNA polymerase II transcription subunit 12 [Portunus trituberculatus]|uniref:Mediator of RNA polymerase II transcription subunit 12 n=1 Tax=Portunus trituberculatus TaxID=210409 RepID=A0A5B7FCZ8_PORTR|nr:Mediator of RNA polymerase II transcription subunit 12 [Portunus trituberculatus]